MSPLGIGIIGLGTVSDFYLNALDTLPNLQLEAVCDVDPTALAPFLGRVACDRDHRRLLENPDVEAVVVTVPNDIHSAVCRDAVEAGRPVCVEKPLAASLDQGRDLWERAAKQDVPLFTAFHRRYNAHIVALARRLPRQRRIETLRVHYRERIEDHSGPESWYLDATRCGGGCIADNGPNAYDLARLFLGELRVSDATVARDGNGIDRQAQVALTSRSGATATVDLDWSYDGEDKRVEVYLDDKSTASADMIAGYPVFKSSLRHEYLGVLRHFERVVVAGEPWVDGGLPALSLVEATYRASVSARAGEK